MENGFIKKRIVEQCNFIYQIFVRYERGEISEERCRLLVDSAVQIKERLKTQLEFINGELIACDCGGNRWGWCLGLSCVKNKMVS